MGKGRFRLQLLAALQVVVCLAAAAGCGSPAAQSTPVIVVTPTASRADEPVTITVTGLPKNAAAEVGLTSTDAQGTVWASKASFTTDDQGTIHTSTATSTRGTYLGVSAVGLLTSMQTPDAASRPELAYFAPASGPSTFQVTAQAGAVQQTATFTRTFFSEPLTRQTLTLSNDKVSGVYLAPPHPTQAQPAVLIVGGSEGGNAGLVLASQFAARGIPALAIAYFGSPGLPKHLADIPLEYFTTALTWLGRQPGVDKDRLWVSGASYGSEAALLLGARQPDLVHGVLTLSGGSTVTCSATAGAVDACDQAPFTDGGKPIPFTRQYDDPAPTDVPAAIIPVEKIKGPVVALCGGADVEWNSCQLSQAVLDRRHQHGTGEDDVLLSYPDAGHYVDFLLPYRPINPLPDTKDAGSTAQSNPLARCRRLAQDRLQDHELVISTSPDPENQAAHEVSDDGGPTVATASAGQTACGPASAVAPSLPGGRELAATARIQR